MPILSLPGELRNDIYDHVIFPEHTEIELFAVTSNKDLIQTLLHHPIFRVCRELRMEAISRLLAMKNFRLHHHSTVGVFMRYLERYICQNLQHLALDRVGALGFDNGPSAGLNTSTFSIYGDMIPDLLKLQVLKTLDLKYAVYDHTAEAIAKQTIKRLRGRGVKITAVITRRPPYVPNAEEVVI